MEEILYYLTYFIPSLKVRASIRKVLQHVPPLLDVTPDSFSFFPIHIYMKPFGLLFLFLFFYSSGPLNEKTLHSCELAYGLPLLFCCILSDRKRLVRSPGLRLRFQPTAGSGMT